MHSSETEGSVTGSDIEKAHRRRAVPHKLAEFLALLWIDYLAVQERLVNPRMADKAPVWQEGQLLCRSDRETKRVPYPFHRLPWRPQPVAGASRYDVPHDTLHCLR